MKKSSTLPDSPEHLCMAQEELTKTKKQTK